MSKIWSENKYIDIFINVLLFLTGINFLHYGQLILPVICFILFIDRKLVFKVNDPLTFVILCLFAISFYAFSAKDFYCVMGFTCPMAYYIGSNILHPTGKNLKKIIYLFAISMTCHVILNGIYEFIVHGYNGFFHSGTHYDFWTHEKISNTATAVNIDLLAGSLYYLIFHEKEKKIKLLNFAVFVIAMFYLLVIGRRTPVMILAISFVLSFLYETIVLKSGSKQFRKSFILLMGSGIALVGILVLVYVLDLFGGKDFLERFYIVQKFSQSFIGDKRIELYLGALKLMPQHLFGKQEISTILGGQVHDFWMDIYDYAGIVTWALMFVYSILYAINIYKLLKSSEADPDLQILATGIFTCIVLQMFVEPVMTGSSLFLVIAIIIIALCERYLPSEQ